MAEIRSYRTESRKDWGTACDPQRLTLEQINTGAILRIADAVEVMAKRHTDLIHDRDFWERRAKVAEADLVVERRRTASLRGHLRRAKKMERE